MPAAVPPQETAVDLSVGGKATLGFRVQNSGFRI